MFHELTDMKPKTFVPPTLPVMLQVLSGAQAAQDLLPAGSVYSLPPNKVIEISIPGGAPGAPVRGSIPYKMLNANMNYSTHSIFTGYVEARCLNVHQLTSSSTISMLSAVQEMIPTTLTTPLFATSCPQAL